MSRNGFSSCRSFILIGGKASGPNFRLSVCLNIFAELQQIAHGVSGVTEHLFPLIWIGGMAFVRVNWRKLICPNIFADLERVAHGLSGLATRMFPLVWIGGNAFV